MVALAVCAVALPFFSRQPTEEQIQYIINVAVRVHGFVDKLGANDSPRTYNTTDCVVTEIIATANTTQHGATIQYV
jgi:hypothetical protein